MRESVSILYTATYYAIIHYKDFFSSLYVQYRLHISQCHKKQTTLTLNFIYYRYLANKNIIKPNNLCAYTPFSKAHI